MLYSLSILLRQQPRVVEMADGMRSEGKIYVVVVGILLLFAGLAFYLYTLDRKLQQLSKHMDEFRADTSQEA